MNYKTFLISITLFFIAFSSFSQDKNATDEDSMVKSGTFTDKRDKKTYEWITIGSQTWMTQNLSYKPKSGGYWAYNHDDRNIDKYGYLYAYIIAKTACPKGWHLPSDDEWRALTKFLTGEKLAGIKMKSEKGWKRSDSCSKATNESGFSALPGGYRDGYGTFYSINEIGYWWTSTASSAIDYAWLRGLYYDRDYIGRYENWRPSGLSVRCVKNIESGKKGKKDTEVEENIEDLK
jgi:uncharacterized protein (TIGR02145 family)